MKKTLSIAAVALMMAGSTAFACGGCGCEDKKADKDKAKTECGSCKGEKAKKADKKETAYNGQTKGDAQQQIACGGHKKDKGKDTDKEKAA